MPSTCKFEFDLAISVFYSGDLVKGRIVLNTTSEIDSNGVYIEFLGRAKVEWSSATEENTFQDEVIYAHSRTEAFPKGKLKSGIHAFDFEVQLPNNAPSSCSGTYGETSYVISLVIDQPRWLDKKFHYQLKVLKRLDLNLSLENRMPLQDEHVKYICCWPCSSGPIFSKLELPFGGYALGQAIKYKLYVDNQSADFDLNCIKLKLRQLMIFTTRRPYEGARTIITTVAKITQHETVLRLTKRVLEGELVIPAVPPTLTTGVDDLINIFYFVQVDINTGWWQRDSKLIIPLTIGTEAVRERESNSRTPIEHSPELRQWQQHLKAFFIKRLAGESFFK